MSESIYNLKIKKTEVQPREDGRFDLVVSYDGIHGAGEQHQVFDKTDVEGILRACESAAQKIFHAEFHLNNAVTLHFTLKDHAGLKLWHTQPNLYVKCELTMKMDWTCNYLSRSYNTMMTLGVVELPSEVPLDGSGLGSDQIAQVIMDSMASGIEFMGNIMMMRESIDHDAEMRRETRSIPL